MFPLRNLRHYYPTWKITTAITTECLETFDLIQALIFIDPSIKLGGTDVTIQIIGGLLQANHYPSLNPTRANFNFGDPMSMWYNTSEEPIKTAQTLDDMQRINLLNAVRQRSAECALHCKIACCLEGN